jgi:hypothetical protein
MPDYSELADTTPYSLVQKISLFSWDPMKIISIDGYFRIRSESTKKKMEEKVHHMI